MLFLYEGVEGSKFLVDVFFGIILEGFGDEFIVCVIVLYLFVC